MNLKDFGISVWTEKNGWQKPRSSEEKFLGIDIIKVEDD